MQIHLPISKSIANRLLILQATHGDELMPVSAATMPDDVVLLHDILLEIKVRMRQQSSVVDGMEVSVKNCGTAMRFLTAFCAQQQGLDITLTCDERMKHRPIGQLVEALRDIGADIIYLDEEGYPPLRIMGNRLNHKQHIRIDSPQSTQFVSALLLIGMDVQTDCNSPYIQMTRTLIEQFNTLGRRDGAYRKVIEADWSAAAFWYEFIVLHGGELTLNGLHVHSVQGDHNVANIFNTLGVQTWYDHNKNRVVISAASPNYSDFSAWNPDIDFTNVPDLYPAVAITAEQLGLPLHATGTGSLRIKESDRLEAVANHEVRGDHRIAMALMAAGLPCDDKDCIKKSYPEFVQQLHQVNKERNEPIAHVTPRRGINDDNKGKKHALLKLISGTESPIIWMHDDDVVLPEIMDYKAKHIFADADMLILPLRMECRRHQPNLLERLQIAEYAAIQQVTIDSALEGKPVMCSGANLLVRRDRWLEAYADIHAEIPSGDDMFILEAFKRRGWNIQVTDDQRMTAYVQPVATWRKFFQQRMRWAGKASQFTDKDILRYGAKTVAWNVAQLLCPLVLFYKFPKEWKLIRRRDTEVSIRIALLLEIVYPIYMLICLIGGMMQGVMKR